MKGSRGRLRGGAARAEHGGLPPRVALGKAAPRPRPRSARARRGPPERGAGRSRSASPDGVSGKAPSPGILPAAALLCAGAFAGLTQQVLSGDGVEAADEAVLGYFVGMRRPWLDALMAAVTSLGSAPGLALLLAIAGVWMGLARRDWRPLAAMAVALAGAVVLSSLAKVAIGRARPEPLYALALGIGSAFPSGHAAQATAGYGALARVLTAGKARPARLAIWCAAAMLVGAVCLSRLYLGVHWLSDVVGGCLLGALWSLVLLIAARAIPGGSAQRAGR